MRKPQPFTIGTRLAIPKCPDLSASSPGVDAASESQSDGASHHPSPLRGSAHSRSPVDHIRPGSLVRSIKRITLSRQADGAAPREGPVTVSPRLLARTSHGNCNNNNSRRLRHMVLDAADLPRDWSVRDPRMTICSAECHKTAKCPGDHCDSALSDGVEMVPSAGSFDIRTGRPSSEPPDTAKLSQEFKQAESWVRCKLQNLTDGGDMCPPTLIQTDARDFESRVMKLSQVSRTPSAASVHPQLQTLRDQWHLLKQAAANQGCAVGGATTLLEFNKKADELEMWMREKEEIPPLHDLLDQNLDKVQITRKILDLKQEQIHYCSLQENINSLGQKLEKQGRLESRAASARRRHLNRMWLQLQTSLHEHQQRLQLALEAASLWHQADTILRAMEEKSRCAELRSRDDQDVRDIAGQVMMLDVAVSQVSNLHPLLSSGALHKQRQVKERWARLRTEKAPSSAMSTIPTREAGDYVTEQSSVGSGRPQTKTSAPQRWPRSQVSGQRPTKRSAASKPQVTHNLQKGQQLHGAAETPEVRRLLRELDSSSQWLQAVELLLSEPAAIRSPELIRKDLKQVSLLERELRSRSSALQRLRGKNRSCQKPGWTVTEEMEVKVLEVEERFQTLQDLLQRRVSDLRDTLVLSEFMKVIEMEEERKKKETIQKTTRGVARGVDRTATFPPLEELQEAVEMLNDAVKERERALAATTEAAELESRVSGLSQMMAAARTKLQDIWSQLEAAEEEIMAVKGEAALRDLQGVISQQQRVEADVSETIDLEVRRLQEQREQLEGLCPARSLSAGIRFEEAMRAWNDLQALVQKNQAQLQRTQRLREFFLHYLGMISWTEVTRGQILSESSKGRLSPAQREELERTMEGKLREFESLAGIGWKLIGEDHLLAQTIRERLEEVQGLLSWLFTRWRCQKRQRIMGNHMQILKTSEAADNMDTPTDTALISSSSMALEEFECPEVEDMTPRPAPRGPILRRYRRRALSPILFQPPSFRTTDVPGDGPRKCAKGPLWLEPKNLPTGSASPEPQEEDVMPPSPHKSFWRRCQGLIEGTFGSLKRKKRVSLPVVDEVSTYLNNKEERQDTYHNLTVPRLSKIAPSSGHDSMFPSCEASFSALPKIRSNVFFKSLRRKEKAQRCTVQGIMGLYSDRKHNTKDASRFQTSTWPPKQEKTFPMAETNIELETFLNYVKNPLSKDIDAECESGSKKPELRSPDPGQHTMPSTCPHLTVGSVLTLQISKDILDNTQDAITVISADDSGNGEHLHSKEKPKPTAGEMVVTNEHSSITGRGPQCLGTRAWLEALTTSPGYCRQNIHGYGKSTGNSQESQELEDLIDTFELDRHSPLVLRHLNHKWNTQEEALNSPKSLEHVLPNCDVPVLQEKERGTSVSPVLQETGGATTSFSVLQETERATSVSPVLQETGGATTSFSVLQETEGVTSVSPVLQETDRATSVSLVLQETGGATTSFSVLQETEGATSVSPILQETGGATTSFSVLQETEGVTSVSPVLLETDRATSVSLVLQETGGATTSFSVLQETEGATSVSPVLQETEGATSVSPALQETEGATSVSPVLQETGGAATSFSVLQETERAISVSPVLQETGGATTSFSFLQKREDANPLSPVHQKTEGATATSPVYQETGGAHCLKKYSANGHPASICSSDYVLHTYEPSNHLHDSYSPIESPPNKRIFTKTNSLPDVLHPDHDFLENDDEELEGIWNNAKKVPPVCPPPASHNMPPKVMVEGSPAAVKDNTHKEPYSRVVIGAEPNMLVATFTLPASAMLSTALVVEKGPNTWKENSPSTVSTPAKCNPKEICEGSSRPQTSPPETVENMSMFKVTRKLDFHLMEGPLEKKHVRQVGGRKASSRTWGTFYAVLVRRTLCFYHDHRHSTKSSVSALPLHLTGAVCTPESDYTKRDNCFRLRLMDGSEYLFRALTPESLQQWVTKLRHNSGIEDSDLLREAAMTSKLAVCPRVISRSLMPDLRKSIPVQAADMVPVSDLPSWKETENVTTESVKQKFHHLPGRFPLSDKDGDPDNNLMSRRRSQSFSSVLYQKVTSVCGPRDSSSSCSVTLYIDDPLVPRGRCHSFAAPQGELLSRNTTDLKLRNKSVFRKFFRKKE